MCSAFKDLGERFDLLPEMVVLLEKFVCKLYEQHDVEQVNVARYNMFRLARKSENAMPPNQDALTQHIKRANYQAGKSNMVKLKWRELSYKFHMCGILIMHVVVNDALHV